MNDHIEKTVRNRERFLYAVLYAVFVTDLTCVCSAVLAEPLWAWDVCVEWIDMHFAVLLEDDLAGGYREECVVFTDANAEAWFELGSALTDDD
jgi:hypothetical protein